MTTVDKFDNYILTRESYGTWRITNDVNPRGNALIDVRKSENWKTGEVKTEVTVNVVSTGPVGPDEAAEVAEEIMRATRAAKYFSGVIEMYESK